MNIRLCGLLNCQYYDNAERSVHAHRLWLTCRRCGRRAVFSERELVERPPLKPIGIPVVIGMDKADAMGDKTYLPERDVKRAVLNEFLELGIDGELSHYSPEQRQILKETLIGLVLDKEQKNDSH